MLLLFASNYFSFDFKNRTLVIKVHSYTDRLSCINVSSIIIIADIHG